MNQHDALMEEETRTNKSFWPYLPFLHAAISCAKVHVSLGVLSHIARSVLVQVSNEQARKCVGMVIAVKKGQIHLTYFRWQLRMV